MGKLIGGIARRERDGRVQYRIRYVDNLNARREKTFSTQVDAQEWV